MFPQAFPEVPIDPNKAHQPCFFACKKAHHVMRSEKGETAAGGDGMTEGKVPSLQRGRRLEFKCPWPVHPT